MSYRKWKIGLLGILALAGGLVVVVGPASAGGWGLGLGSWGWGLFGGCKEHCPPPYTHCSEGPPRLHFKRRCPRPVCPPCQIQHYGYYQPCWRPWPFPPDFRHCPAPVPAAHVPPAQPAFAHAYGTPSAQEDDGSRLPTPKQREGAGTPFNPTDPNFPSPRPMNPGTDPGTIPPIEGTQSTGPLQNMSYQEPRITVVPR